MYRPEIDGMRALAVLAVIIGHFDFELLPNGHLGVDIFFVISGFVITQSLLSRQHRSFFQFVTDFYTRRVKRLMPALLLCVAVTSMLVLLFMNPEEESTVLAAQRTGLTSLVGLSNLYLLWIAVDYFSPTAELNPFTHTWSLGVEEQFYLFFPLILWVTGYVTGQETGRRIFVWTISSLAIMSLVGYMWVGQRNAVTAFYLMPTRFWELGFGAMAYVALSKFEEIASVHSQGRANASWVIGALLAVALLLPNQYPAITTFAVVLLTTALILSLTPESFVYRLLTIKPVVYIGLISYSLYLWHWSVLTISRWTIGLSSLTAPFLIGLVFLLAILSYHFIEKPFRYSNWSFSRFRQFRVGAIGRTGIVTLMFVAASLFVFQFHAELYAGTTSASLIKKGAETLLDTSVFNGEPAWHGEECVLSSNNDVGKQIDIERCTFGDFKTAKRRFLVIGDSYSAAEVEMYKILAERNLGAVTITSSTGASPVPEIEHTAFWGKANDYYWSTIVPELVDQLQPNDVIMMINDGAEFSPKSRSKKADEKLFILRTGLKRFSNLVAERGISVIYQSGIPFLRESRCSPDIAVAQWWTISNDERCIYYARDSSLQRRSHYHKLLLQLEEELDNFHVLDLFDVFCADEVCRFYSEEGTFLYRDEFSHASVEACRLAQPVLLETVMKVTNKPHEKFNKSSF